MRVLVTTSPGLGHIFPAIGLTWAFRAHGHQVLMATAGRSASEIEAVVSAGLPVAEIASTDEVTAARQALVAKRRQDAERRGITDENMIRLNVEEARRAKEITDGNGFVFARRIYGPLSAATLDGLVRVARWWKPDLVLHESLQGGGPLVATMLGVPAVEHPIGFSRGPQIVEALREDLAADYRRLGVSGCPPATEAIDVTPPSLGVGPEHGLTMRYVPYSGGGILGGWAGGAGDRSRPQIGVTIGSVLPGQVGLGPLVPILAAARKVDADFVLTLGGADPAALGPLPPNVTAYRYLPLTMLLRSCDAAIHHGGAGSTLSALDAGIPQLVLPQVGDQFINAEAVRKRGCGLVVEEGAPDAGTLRALLDRKLVATAQNVAEEMAMLPSPADLVPRLAALAA